LRHYRQRGKLGKYIPLQIKELSSMSGIEAYTTIFPLDLTRDVSFVASRLICVAHVQGNSFGSGVDPVDWLMTVKLRVSGKRK